MRRRLADYRVTPAGGALLLVLAAAVTVLLVGPHHDEVPAFIVVVIVLAVFVVGAGSNLGSSTTLTEQSVAERRERFRPQPREGADVPDLQGEEEAWRRERETYAERDRGPGT